jgi:MoxR-like ATPase
MMVLGAGGTGKTLLIGAITETFEYHEDLDELAKSATTGIASADIGGSTLHSLIGLGRGKAKEDWLTKTSAKIQKKRRTKLQGKKFLIIDEISMADKATFCCASQAFALIRGETGTGDMHAPFGGAHVILLIIFQPYEA